MYMLHKSELNIRWADTYISDYKTVWCQWDNKMNIMTTVHFKNSNFLFTNISES